MGLIKVFRMEYDLFRLPCLEEEYSIGYVDSFVIDKPRIAYEIFREAFRPELKVEEYMYLMACDAADHVKGLFIVSQGMINGTLLNVYGIMQRALLCGASQIIVAHNHPSGECNISKEDEACCKQLKSACDIMGITLMDFMILGNCEYSSFKEKWLL